MKPSSTSKRRRLSHLGPGTILALLLTVGIAYSGHLKSKSAVASDTGKVVFEADTSGHMRQVEAPSTVKSSPPKLWKPEPKLLLESSSSLKLDEEQRTKIKLIQGHWQIQKSKLENEISLSTIQANERVKSEEEGRSISMTHITENLQQYSRLSGEYEERRSAYWRNACAVLTAKQRKKLDEMHKLSGRTNKL